MKFVDDDDDDDDDDGRKDPYSKMTCKLPSGTLNSAHSPTTPITLSFLTQTQWHEISLVILADKFTGAVQKV